MNFELLEQAAVFRYHKALVKDHGRGTTGALGWTTPEGQRTRFAALAAMSSFSHCSVLDAGCGHGDFYPFLKARFTDIRYYGVEQIPQLLDVAAERYGHEKDAVFFSGDFLATDLPVTDYVVACGSLSYRHSDPDFIYKAIRKLYRSCRVGLGFNLLSKEPVAGGLLCAYDPRSIVAYCQSFAENVTLVDDYHDGDFTVYIRCA